MGYNLLVILLLVNFWKLQAGDLQKYNIKVNTDCFGSWLQTIDSLTQDQCDDRCLDKSGCTGFVYDNDDSTCVLKRGCTNFQMDESRDFYTTVNHVCTWQPHSSCPDQFDSAGLTYQGCSYEGQESNPWCESTSTQCSKSCQRHDLAFQYGSVLTVYKRDFYDIVDTSTTYQMVYVDTFGRSGLITRINLDVAEINRELAVGIFRSTGVGRCDLTLIREISLHDIPAYKEHLQYYGIQQITLDIMDFMPVTPYLHLGVYWGEEGSLYTTDDSRAVGYQMCGYDLQKSTHVRFVPFMIQSSTGFFQRHYSLDVVIETADTDLNWMLNAALFRSTVIDEVTYSHQEGTLVITDGDYDTCQSTSSGLIELDMDKVLAIKLVKLKASANIGFSASVKRSRDDTASQNCGTLASDKMADGHGALSCAEGGVVGRYITITVQADATICEVEVILTALAETCLGDACYYVTSQLVDSAGVGEEECQRHYASATMFEPQDQGHWDEVSQWYQQLTLAENFTDAAVGMTYSGGAWVIQSSSNAVPVLDWGDEPETYNYALLDFNTGKPTATSSGSPHYALCQVSKSIVDATYKTLLRAPAGCNVDLYNLWIGNTITPQVTDSFSSALISTLTSDTDVYKSPLITCQPWSHIKEVRLSLYKDNTEVLYMLFTVGNTVEDWFIMSRLKGSSYHDLPVSVNSHANYASMFGDTLGGANRRWYLNARTSDCENSGWLTVLDLGHESTCAWDSLSGLDAPQFLYSNKGSYSSNWIKADVFVITGRFDQSSFGGPCVDTCEGVSDGDYQSCLGCNVYSKCVTETLTYHTCRHGLQFDSEQSQCLNESTTCTAGTAQKSCETGCPDPDPCVEGDCVFHDEDSGLDGWSCVCNTGFSSDLCDVNIDDCAVDSCNSHGDCNDLVNDFNCSCHGGYKGEFCEKVDYCYENEQCMNGGICIDGDTEYTCNCTIEYFGEHCQYVDECVTESQTCTEQGECLRQQTGWVCNCSEGFVGPECEFEDPCVKANCDLESSTCNLTIDYLNYFCACDNGQIGDNCDEKNPCQNSPCVHGTCGVIGSSIYHYHYTCDCEGNYWTGDTCSLGPCDRATLCQHLGTCTNVPDDPDGYICTCLHWYEGKNCSVEIPISSSDGQIQPSDDEDGAGMGVGAIAGLTTGLLVVAILIIVIIVVKMYRKKKVEDQRKTELEKNTYKSRIKDAPTSFQYWTGEGAQNYNLQNKDRYILTPHY